MATFQEGVWVETFTEGAEVYGRVDKIRGRRVDIARAREVVTLRGLRTSEAVSISWAVGIP